MLNVTNDELKETTGEVWKPIKGYEGIYEVSSKGRIKSLERQLKKSDNKVYKLKEKILKFHLNPQRYSYTFLSKNGEAKRYLVHRLVGQAFIPNPENKPNINHIDGTRDNNHVSNLEWCTQSENMLHACKTGLKETNIQKFKDQILEEYTTGNVGINELAAKYGCASLSISKLLKSKGIKQKTQSELINKYKIDRKEMIKDFEAGLSNKEIAKKHNTNNDLICTYRYKYKKGELKI